GQDRLDLVDVNRAVELLLDRVLDVLEPDEHLGVTVEVTGRLHREVRDAAIRDRFVLDLLAGDALLVDEDQPPVGEQHRVTDELESGEDALALTEDAAELLRRRVGIYWPGVSGDPTHDAH